MSDCLQCNALSDVLQEAAQRLPRKTPRTAKTGTRDASRERIPTAHNSENNYLAEASAMRGEGPESPLGGRNRKGAGAPPRNRNARGTRALRHHRHLKKRLLAEHLQLLVLAAAVSHLERRVSPQNPARALQRKDKFSQNNYLAEAPAMHGEPTLHDEIPSRHAEVLRAQSR